MVDQLIKPQSGNSVAVRRRIHHGRNRRRALGTAAVFAASICLSGRFTNAANVIATWTGSAGDGSWSNAANWTPSTTPVNAGLTLYNVIVPSGVNITYDEPVPTTINGISYGSGGSLTLGTGEQLTVSNVAALNSNITASGANTLFSAAGVGVSMGNDVQLNASGGAVIAVGPVSYTFDASAVETNWSADGAGSVISATALGTITNTGPDYFTNSQDTFSATNGGVINLSGLNALVGGSGPGSTNTGYAANFFFVGAGSSINMASLKMMTQYNVFNIQSASFTFPSLQTIGGTSFTLAVGTNVTAPVLTSVAGWQSYFNIPSSAVFNAPQLTTLNDATISIAVGGTMNVPQLEVMQDSAISLAPGETFNYKPPINFDNSRVFLAGGSSFTIAAATYTYNRNAIETAWSADGTGSLISAQSVTTITNTGPTYFANSQETFSATNGGTIDLSGLQSLVGGAGSPQGVGYAGNFFTIGAGSNINLASLKTITLYNTFNIQSSSYTFPSLQQAGGTTFTLAIGTTVTAPVLTTLAGWSSGFNIPNFATFSAPNLTTLNDTTIAISVGGVLNVPQLQMMQDSALSLQPGETFNYKPPVSFDNSRISVTGGSTFSIAAASYNYNRNAVETAWSADGVGSLISAPSITTLSNTGPNYFANSQPTFSATDGGTINLSGLQTLIGGIGAYTGTAENYFTVSSGGTIRFGNLVVSQYNAFSADGATAKLEFQSLQLNSQSTLVATNLANVLCHGSLSYTTTTASSLNLDQGVVTFATNGRPTLEIAGTDLGTNTNGLNNFGMQQLNVGTSTQRTVLELVDQYHNAAGSNPALYLLNVSGNGLQIDDGSTLVLNGLNAYTLVNNQFINLNSLFGPGQSIVAYGGGFLAKTLTNIPGGWKNDGNGNWSGASNWNLSVPGSPGDTAYFGPVITAPRTVTLDVPESVGYIGFEGAQEYTIAGSNKLTINGISGGNIEVVSGTHQITAPVSLATDTQVAVDNPNDSLRLTNVSAAPYATITKVGAGALTINPVGSTAELTIAAGTVNMLAAPAAGAGSFDTVTVDAGATWSLVSYGQSINTLAGSGAINLGFARLTVMPGSAGSNYSGTITGSAGVENAGLTVAGVVTATVPGSGLLTLSGSTTYQGDTNIVSGGLTFGAPNVASGNSAFTVAAGATLNLNNNNQQIGSLAGAGGLQLGTATLNIGGSNQNTTFSGSIAGTGGITLTGSGNLTLAGSNTFTGPTTINAGSIILLNKLALQNSTVQINTDDGLNENRLTAVVGAISGNGALNLSGSSLTVGGNNATTAYGGTISGVGQLIKAGSGTLYLQNSNSFAGGTVITGGTLDINSDTELGAANTSINLSGGTLFWDTANAWTDSRPMAVAASSYGTLQTNSATITMNAPISGSGTFVKTGTGEVVFATANTVGGVNVESGQLDLGATESAGAGLLAVTNIPSGASVVLSKTTGSPATVLTNPVQLNPGAVAITLRVDSPFTLMLNGPLSGSADFSTGGGGATGTNVGTGTLVLAGNNSAYTGTITVATGTLSVQSATALGSTAGSTQISPGATLNFQGPLIYGSAEPLALAGTVSATGGITVFPGTVDLAGPASISVDSNSSLSVAGINGGFPISKSGAGALIVAGASSSGASVNVAGGSIIYQASQHLSGLAISSGASVQITGGGNGNRSMLYTPSLSVAGTLDLTGNDLDIQAGGPAALAAISALVAQGYGNGTWTGAGITSSSAAADSTHLTALGVILNTVGGTAPLLTSLDGSAVAVNDLLVKYTYYGDTDLKGYVDGSDYSRIDNAYLSDQSNPGQYTGWYNGDFNYDGVIDGSDYTLIDNAFNQQGAQLSAIVATAAQIADQSAPVPEPAAVGLIAAGMFGMLGRRNRRCV